MSGEFQAISGNFGYIRIDPVGAIENPGDILQPQDAAALKIFSSTVNNPASGTMFTISDFTNGQGWIVSSGGGLENIRGIALHPRLDSGAGISGIVFGAISNHGTMFRTNNLNRMVISSGGLVGIGTNVPTEALEVAGTVMTQALVSSGGVVLDENAQLFFGPSGSASHPSLRRSTTQLEIMLGDNSTRANLISAAITAFGNIQAAGGLIEVDATKVFRWGTTRAQMKSEVNGEVTIYLADGSTSGVLRAASGIFSKNIIPDTSGGGQLGTRSRPWASGVFDDGFWIRGETDTTSPGFDRNGGNIRTVAMNGALTNIESNSLILNNTGSILWNAQGGFTSPADG